MSFSESFSHQDESAHPGFYSVKLANAIDVALTATDRTGFGRFSYPTDSTPNMVINGASDIIFASPANWKISSQTSVRIDPSARSISGVSESGHFCRTRYDTQPIYFYAVFNRPFASYGTWGDATLLKNETNGEGRTAGAYVTFNSSKGRTVLVKIGISYVSVADAKENLEAENPGSRFTDKDFHIAVRRAGRIWNSWLNRVQVSGGYTANMKTFYSMAYHTLLGPTICSDVNGKYPGADGKIHALRKGHLMYSNFSGWDIYRSEAQFLAMIAPRHASDMAQSLLLDYQQGGTFPRWPVPNMDSGVMMGDPAAPIIADFYAFGARDFDVKGAFDGLMRAATDTTVYAPLAHTYERDALGVYLKFSYVPEHQKGGYGCVSMTLEYGAADFALSRMATSLGRKSDAGLVLNHAQDWKNLYNPATGYLQMKEVNGDWTPGFADTVLSYDHNQAYVEGTAPQYVWAVQWNLKGLAEKMGGEKTAASRLDDFLRELNAGVRSKYCYLGNEPCLETPWEFDFFGEPYRTQEIVRRAVTTLYSSKPRGFPGNDDLGEMSSWYIFSALGMYPEEPGLPMFVFGSPLFPKAEIHMHSGTVTIIGHGAKDATPYIHSLVINGKKWSKPWMWFTEIEHGGTIDYTLSPMPDKSWGSAPNRHRHHISDIQAPQTGNQSINSKFETLNRNKIQMAKSRNRIPLCFALFPSHQHLILELRKLFRISELGFRISYTVPLLFLLCGSLYSQTPGEMNGRTLLANGWWLTPAGHSIKLSTMPLNAAVSPGQKYIAVTNDGWDEPTVMLVDLKHRKVVQSIKLKDSWLGIKFHGNKLYVSGGNQNCVYTFNLVDGHLQNSDTIQFLPPHPKAVAWTAGLDVHGDVLAAVFRADNTLRYYDRQTHKFSVVKLDGMPYACKFLKDGTLLVSIWSSKKIEAFEGTNLLYEVPTGAHPTEIAVTRDGKTAFVANANDNSVTMINLKTHKALANISISLYPDSPEGATPNSVCITPDGKRLLVADADNNDLAVVNLSDPERPVPIGFIPVGWYPTKVLELKNGTVLVVNGKGNRSKPNPGFKEGSHNRWYIGRVVIGTLSFFKFPGHEMLAKYTKEVYANTPYRPKDLETAALDPDNPIPSKVGGKSPIKYVFYFIKENRTYDQVLGDIKRGNGDPNLVLFGEKITPNIHKLVRDYVLLDNLYANAEVSADGHNWSDAAYATDFVQKSWQNNYGGRGGPYDFEGGVPTSSPASGFIWNDCLRHGVSFRDYGEFVYPTKMVESDLSRYPKVNDSKFVLAHIDTSIPNTPLERALFGHTDVWYHSWDLKFSDVDRYKEWNQDFTRLVREGKLPHLSIIRLPNDHTWGTTKGAWTPQAMVAQNDYALGLFVNRISHSRIWDKSAIFVIEDDAQDGADHVDEHRTEGLVISPYVKRGFVDNTLYTTSSMLRTMELILGLPPMSQYDAAATPMFNSFTMNIDTARYTVVNPMININARNPLGAYGQSIMDHWNFAHADMVPPREFNEILWRAIKGTSMPIPRYSIYSAGS